MQSFIFSIHAVFPVFLLILLGAILSRTNFITPDFISISSKLVFRIALPVLVFRNVSATDFSRVFNPTEILLTVGMTILFCVLLWFISGKLSTDPREHGPFVQGAFRGNIGIIATAIAMNMYGPDGAAMVATHLCFLMPLFNIMAVIILTASTGKNQEGTLGKILFRVITNPLVIAVVISLPFSLYSIPIPRIFQEAVNFTAQLTLPLALIGVGGSLSFSAFGKHPGLAILSSAVKLIILPAASMLAAYLLRIELENPGIILLLMGAPTAVASFIMTREMGGDEILQANIIALTTFASMFTLGLGIFIMKYSGVI